MDTKKYDIILTDMAKLDLEEIIKTEQIEN